MSYNILLYREKECIESDIACAVVLDRRWGVSKGPAGRRYDWIGYFLRFPYPEWDQESEKSKREFRKEEGRARGASFFFVCLCLCVCANTLFKR